MRWTLIVLPLTACGGPEPSVTLTALADEHCTPGRSCGGDQTCVKHTLWNGDSRTLCTVGPADLRCNDNAFFCDGDVLVSCTDGYPVNRRDCAFSGLYCAPAGRCATRTDALCDPRGPTTLRCDGVHLVKCVRDQRSNVDCDLDAGFACGEGDGGFSCLYRGTL